MEPIFVSRMAAAELLSVSIPTIDRMLADGRLPSVKIAGCRRIPLASLKEMAAA